MKTKTNAIRVINEINCSIPFSDFILEAYATKWTGDYREEKITLMIRMAKAWDEDEMLERGYYLNKYLEDVSRIDGVKSVKLVGYGLQPDGDEVVEAHDIVLL